jgi:hypothetical protein
VEEPLSSVRVRRDTRPRPARERESSVPFEGLSRRLGATAKERQRMSYERPVALAR